MKVLTIAIVILDLLSTVAIVVNIHYARREEKKVTALLTLVQRLATDEPSTDTHE